jgi:hypothetical protein
MFESSPFLVMVKVKPQLRSPRPPGDGRPHQILQLPRANVIKMEDDPSTAADEVREMPFEVVMPPESTQEDIYIRAGKPILERALAGYNSSIFVYGQTGKLSYDLPLAEHAHMVGNGCVCRFRQVLHNVWRPWRLTRGGGHHPAPWARAVLSASRIP